jgi:hypothetical protein
MSITLQVIFLLAIDVMVEGYTTSTSFCRHLGIYVCFGLSLFFPFSFVFHTTSIWSMCCFVVRVSVLFYTSILFFYNSFILQVDWCLLLQFRKVFEGASSFLYTHGDDVYCVIVKKSINFYDEFIYGIHHKKILKCGGTIIQPRFQKYAPANEPGPGHV